MIVYNFYPKLDLHGEYTTTAYTVIHEFIKDNIKLKNEFIVLIHGKGTGKLKKEVHYILDHEKKVLSYQLDPYNLGQTIVHLKIN